jgi:hypothetical protein
MRGLLYSAVLYLAGICIVLYIRPQFMFRRDGKWKEFGVNDIDTTYFPFWMFCIVWAVVAHAIVRLLVTDDEGIVKKVAKAARSAAATVAATTGSTLTSYVNEPLAASTPVASPEPTEEAQPGYYKLDDSLMRRKGVPRYIFVGHEKPDDLDDE